MNKNITVNTQFGTLTLESVTDDMYEEFACETMELLSVEDRTNTVESMMA